MWYRRSVSCRVSSISKWLALPQKKIAVCLTAVTYGPGKSGLGLRIQYSPAHRGVERIYLGEDQGLAMLNLPSLATDNHAVFVLQPGMMDAALQAAMSLFMAEHDPKPLLPFALQYLDFSGPCASRMW